VNQPALRAGIDINQKALGGLHDVSAYRKPRYVGKGWTRQWGGNLALFPSDETATLEDGANDAAMPFILHGEVASSAAPYSNTSSVFDFTESHVATS
jgi:hypothetical protein